MTAASRFVLLIVFSELMTARKPKETIRDARNRGYYAGETTSDHQILRALCAKGAPQALIHHSFIQNIDRYLPKSNYGFYVILST